jgi:uncharacterized membrane protein YgcG
MANEYEVNYDDQRFKDVESQKTTALKENQNLYNGMIEDSNKYYEAQINASKNWAEEQKKLQQEQTNHAINKIEQEKEKANKSYLKEQSGAYTDWQKQSNQYGANAEQMAAAGLQNSGFSESSQVSMYNTYQNRVATARESYNNAVVNYNNAIKDAQLQNNSILAEIAFKALEQQLKLSLEGFQAKNNLLIEQANKKMQIDSEYYGRWQDVLNQINQEHSLAEQIRQYNESMALEREQFEWQKAQAKKSSSGGGSSRRSSSSSKKSSSSGGSGKINKTNGSSGTSGHGINRESASELKSKQAANNSFEKQVLNLGYGPISAKEINKKVKSGAVKETVKNGKVTLKKSNPTSLLKFSKYKF